MFAAVGKIDHNAHFVQTRDHFAAEGGQPAIARRHRSVADLVGGIVGELDDANAEIGENVDPARVFADHRRVLEAEDDADPPLPLRAQHVGGGQHLEQIARHRGEARLPGRDLAHRILERIAVARDIADRLIDDIHARGARIGDEAGRKDRPLMGR